jgi:hypothetical protein
MSGYKRKEVTEGKRKQGNEEPHNFYSFLMLLGDQMKEKGRGGA